MPEAPAYVLWILLLPAIAAVIQHFFGARLPRKGDFLVVGAMAGALALSVMTLFEFAALPKGEFFHSSWTWFGMADGVQFKLGILVDGLTAALNKKSATLVPNK